MNILFNRLSQRHGSLFTQIFSTVLAITLLVCVSNVNAQVIVKIEDVIASNGEAQTIDSEGYLKMMKSSNLKNLVAGTTNELSSNLVADISDVIKIKAPATLNYTITYNSSENKIIIWVAGEYTLNGVTVKDSNDVEVYSGGGTPGEYSAPGIGSGNNTVYLSTSGGPGSETVNVN